MYCDEAQYKLIRERLESDEGLRDYARSKLVEFVLSNDDDNDFVQLISAGFFHLSWDVPDAARELFVAVSARWSAVSKPLLGRYEELIGEHSSDEPVFQRFFTQHPQLLDPMAVTVWPHPRLHGSQIPDFLIRRSDDTYLVVEIETPAKQLVTLQNQLAADATHAVSQVTEYMRFLARISGAQIYFPSIDEIHGLVVVGLERDLNDRQKQALRNDNRQRHAVRIVGFDWLADRAGAIQKNIISTGISVQSAQVS